MSEPPVYDAFISYSHAADGRLAPALQRAFHRFARPVFKVRALRVFRDKESLSADPALWGAIERALARSGYFVLLASAEAARSRWVNREVNWWIDNRSVSRLLIVLTGGEIVWDADKGVFDWDRTNALPDAMRGRVADEPLWVDLRWARTADDLSLRHSQFRAAVLDLVAPIHGKPKDELDSEDVRQHRRTRLLARSAVALLTVLTITATVLALYAVRQRDEAERQRNEAVRQRREAERQRDLALSRQTGAQSQRVRNAALDTSLLLAVEASRRAGTFEARNALLSALGHAPHLAGFLPGHHAPVMAAAFSPDGRTLVSGSADVGMLRFWDVARRQVLGTPMVAHADGVTRVAFSPDGRLLASAGRDRTVRLWDVATRQPVGAALAGHADVVARLAFSPDGSRLATGDDGGAVIVWDVATRTATGAPLAGRLRGVTALAFDDAGTSLAAGDGFGLVVIWDLRTPEASGTSYSEGQFFVIGLEFAPDGHAVAAGLSNANLILWDVGQAPPRVCPVPIDRSAGIAALDTRAAAIRLAGHTMAVAGPDGAVIVAEITDDGDREPLPERASLRGPRSGTGIMTLALSPDGNGVASGYRDGSLVLWNLVAPHVLARDVEGRHARDVTALAFAPHGATLASGSDDRTVMFWDTAALRPAGPPLTGHAAGVTAVAFSPDGASMITGDHDGTTLFWDVVTRRPLGPAVPGDRRLPLNRVIVAPDGALMVTAGGGGLQFWDMTTRRVLGPPLDAKQAGVTSAAFSPDGKLLVTGGVDGTVALWDVAGRRRIGETVDAHRGESVNSVAFSPDGSTIASVGRDARLNLFPLKEGRLPDTARPLAPIDREQRQGIGGAVAFSPDGRTVISAGNGRLVVWDVASGQPLDHVLQNWGRITPTRLAMNSDGTTVAVGIGDGVRLWDVGLSTWQRRACQIANRDLTVEEWNRFIGAEFPYRRTCQPPF